MDDDKIKILIVDDSKVTRDLIKHLLSINPHVEITGTAENGVEALEFIRKTPPDVVLTDIVMPKMNGFELTKKIMEISPMPVIVMSGVYNAEEIRKSFEAIDAGAVAIMEKPQGIADEHFADTAKFIFDTARLLSNIRGFNKPASGNEPAGQKKLSSAIRNRLSQKADPRFKIKVIAIGSSVGGPKALQTLLSPLTPATTVPILIVQHIAPGFVKGFADWLNENIALTVDLAVNSQELLPGHVYIAPDKYHMEVDRNNCIKLQEVSSSDIYVPSIGRLFQSLANNYGSNAMGVLLLGSEKDGLKDLLLIKEKGGFAIGENNPAIKRETALKSSIDESGSIEELAGIIKDLVSTS